MHRVWWLVYLGLLQGCATLSRQEVVAVPAILQPYFGDCSPTDGAVSLAFFRDGTLIGSGDAEWVAKNGLFTLEMLDPVGRLLLKLQQEAGALVTTGPLTRKIPAMRLRKDGFLDFNGHMVPIRASELPCVLAGQLPHAWIGLTRQVDGQTITAADANRTITINFDRPKTPGAKVCSRITWGGLAWFKHELTWCQHGTVQRESYLDGDGDFGIRIVKAKEDAA